jgi:RHS repeat-associated protein
MQPLNEKPCLGLTSNKPALHPEQNVPNFTAEIGDSWRVASKTQWSHEMGRFLSPDWNSDPDSVPYADFGNPQTLNLYSYVQNNPLSRTDPDGHACVVNADGSQTDDDSGGESCADVAAADELHPASVIVTPNGEDEPLNPYAQGVANGIGARSGAAMKGLGYGFGASVAIGSGVGAGLAYGGAAAAGVTQLSLEAPAIAATLSPLVPAAGDKMQNIIARLGQGFYGNPQQAMQALTDLRDAAVSDGTLVEADHYIAQATIFRSGNDFLTVSQSGQVLSFVKNATAGTGVALKYFGLGGK